MREEEEARKGHFEQGNGERECGSVGRTFKDWRNGSMCAYGNHLVVRETMEETREIFVGVEPLRRQRNGV